MQTLIQTAPLAMPRATRRLPLWLRALNWLAAVDARHRQKQHLRALPDGRLADMGMTRHDADRAFLTRGGDPERERIHHPIPRWIRRG